MDMKNKGYLVMKKREIVEQCKENNPFVLGWNVHKNCSE